MLKNESFNDEVTGIAFGGNGIVRHDGMVVFIPYTAKGDKITYQIENKKKHFATGKLLHIDQASPQRTVPLCPYFGTCGGCQLQHITYQTQLDYKREWVEEALKKQGGLQDIHIPPVEPSHLQWAYRRRISLTLRPNYNSYQAGYIANDNRTLLEITQCPIFIHKETSLFTIIHQLTQSLACHHPAPAKLTILKRGDKRYIFHFHFKVMPKNGELLFQKTIKDHVFIAGILASSPQKNLQYGQIDTAFNIDGLHFDFSPKAFIQTHPDQSANIYKEICEHASIFNNGNALDLYCGIGVSSLLLAKQGLKVTGIELNGSAIQLAKTNAKKNKVTNVNFHQETVENVLSTYLNEEKPKLVIVNPPREGLMPSVVQDLIHSPVEMLVYISCMPPTLGRDLKLLCQSVYTVKSVKAYDMFPQTAHVETLVVLIKK